MCPGGLLPPGRAWSVRLEGWTGVQCPLAGRARTAGTELCWPGWAEAWLAQSCAWIQSQALPEDSIAQPAWAFLEAPVQRGNNCL